MFFTKTKLDTTIKVLEFRKLRVTDRLDKKYGAWSRIYEYPLVLDVIKKYKNDTDISIHNSSWGFEGCHIIFKDDLDKTYKDVLHTDILPSKIDNTDVYDITKQPPEEYVEKFDVVINVSTVEEVKFDHITIFNNLLAQVKKGGILICTFDLPGLQLRKFEKLFGRKITTFDDDLNGSISANPNPKYKRLQCGLMVVEK